MTGIEWTEATWNPIAGCSILSPGCTNCYAMRTAARLARIEATAPTYAGLTQPSKAGSVWTGRIMVNESTMLAPLNRKKPTMYFVNSMSDLFHESVPNEVIDRVFAVMALCQQHTFQVLTKRSERMRDYCTAMAAGNRSVISAGKGLAKPGVLADRMAELAKANPACSHTGPLPNVWLGVSVEDQKRADERIPDLLATPAAVRFLSCEPLLGRVDLTKVQRFKPGVADREWLNAIGGKVWTDQSNLPNPDLSWSYPGKPFSEGRGLDWVIVGGESGPGARPMHPNWARALRDQCAAADVPFFFKQWGSWAPVCEMTEAQIDACYHPAPISRPEASRRTRRNSCVLHADGQRFDGEAMFRRPAFEQGSRAMTMFSIGKKASGRLLDGAKHDAMPDVPA